MTSLHLKWIGGFAVVFRRALIALALAPLLLTDAAAFIRAPMWDDDLVDQSDLIVIAHLKENRFEIEKDPQDPEFAQKVFFTTIVVSQVLKGTATPGDLRVGLHDPNYPTVLGGPFALVPAQAGEHPDPSAAIGVAAIVGTIMVMTTDDIRHDQIWFLRSHAPPRYPSAAVAGPPGLWFPEGIQPVKLIPYYQAIIKGDAKAVAAFDDKKDDWWSTRVRFASERISAKQTLIERDPSARCDELLKIYTTDGAFSPPGILALKEIMDCGKLGASKLIPLFVNADDHAFDRRSILQAWQGAGYKEATPFILSWLRAEEDWWETKTTADMVFGSKAGAPYNDPRAVSFRNIFCSIEALGGFRGEEARNVVQRIRNHWKAAAPFDTNNDLLKTCDDALAALQ